MLKRLNYLAILFIVMSWAISATADLQDPTRPADAGEMNALEDTDNNGLILSAILYEAHHSAAIINGRVIHVGEKIFNFQLKTIDKNQVILINPQGHLITLSMPHTILQPSS